MLKCRDIAKHADDYIDGKLSFRQRLSFRFHLLICKNCHRYINKLSKMVGCIKHAHDNEPDQSEIDEVYRLIKNVPVTNKEITNE
jgi:anti-sigma factor ChrR (cupin superfamily)